MSSQQDDDTQVAADVRQGRVNTVGGARVLRVLPTKGRRTVGAWCFADLIGADAGDEQDPMEVGPHPHTGLATVTWLLEGAALHTDSLGTEQLVRPGELNLMHAGRGIAHAERGGGRFRGVQLWIAQPEQTRHGAGAFEHHAELPRTNLGRHAEAVVLVGHLGGVSSPARSDSDLVGAELTLWPGASDIEVQAGHEHAVIPLERPVLVGGELVEVGSTAIVAAGTSVLPIRSREKPTKVLLLGGTPMGETIQMWWNFVARTRDELTEAWRDWSLHDDGRFGRVQSVLGRIDAPVPPWVRGV